MGKDMNILREIIINKPVQQVFDYIKITKNQDDYSVWNMADPQMTKEYQGTDGQKGFVYKWDSKKKNVGAGEQEIKKIEANKSIEYELRFSRPMKNIADSNFTLVPESADQTRLQWSFSGPTKFPMSLFKSIFQKMLGKDMEKGLVNLKAIMEK